MTIINSTINGNRADDRGGAISGEADVSVIGSTIARNAAVAHVGGGVWARDDLYVTNSTIARNSAEGVGGGLFAAGELGLVHSTVLDNAAPVAGSLAAGDGLMSFGSIIGPTNTGTLGGQVPPTEINCRVGRRRIRRLQLHQRPLVWARRIDRPRGRPGSEAGGAGRQRRRRRDADAGATSPVIDAIPIEPLSSDPVRIQPRGRTAPGGVRHRSAGARHVRSARRRASRRPGLRHRSGRTGNGSERSLPVRLLSMFPEVAAVPVGIADEPHRR